VRYLSFVVLLFISVFFAGQGVSASDVLHVILDPGHGGSDNGAVRDDIKESEIVLKVAQRLAALLKKDKRFKVTLTREKDEFKNLYERTNLARETGGEVFLSIHANSNLSEKAKGAEIYFQNQMPPDEESRFLASRENIGIENSSSVKKDGDIHNIVEDLRRSYFTHLSFGLARQIRSSWGKIGKSPQIRQGPFHVLYEVSMPSALVELGFVTNPEEAQWLAKADTHRTLAEILYHGLVEYKERLDKKKPRS
jgi:N-acetylmuramoyl-L-alanine amidase